jgi:hypothetical protein
MRRPARQGIVLPAALSLLLCVAVCVPWLRSNFLRRYEGVTYNSKPLADGGQLHFCISTGPFGVVFSHHRLKVAGLKVGWLPFSARSGQVSRPAIQNWYVARGGHGAAGIWWLSGGIRDDRNGVIYQIFIPHWILAWLVLP